MYKTGTMEKLLPVDYTTRAPQHKKSKVSVLKFLLATSAVTLITLFVTVSLAHIYQLNVVTSSSSSSTSAQTVTTTKSFKAAVYEEKLVSVYNAVSREEALKAIRQNLANMDKQAKIAFTEGVNVMVFAEYGITGSISSSSSLSRSSVYPYLEEIPDVSPSHPACVSCDSIDPALEGQTTIGCMALKYNMYMLANLIESVPCDTEQDSLCPSDGHYQYNTNIVYDPNGCLIAKYHKYHRFQDEFAIIDKPAEPERVYFDTEYGRFGTFICADILYKDPPITLVKDHAVDHILFPTFWIQNGLAFFSAIDWQLAYATMANVNFVGAAVYDPIDFTFGSSILSGSKVINCTSIDKSVEGMLITGVLPCSSKPTKNHQTLPAAFPSSTTDLLNQTANIAGDLYDVIKLDNITGSVKVCQHALCCTLDYNRNYSNETYILGAFKGIHEFAEALAAEVCIVTKCGSESLSSCGDPEINSTTAFSHFRLSAKFSVEYVYPNLTPSNLQYTKLNFTFVHSATEYYNSLVSSSDWPLVSVALVGRDFQNDPVV